MNLSDNDDRGNGTRDGGDGYGGGNVDELSGGGYFGNGYGGGWSIHGGGWPTNDPSRLENRHGSTIPDFGDIGNGFGLAGGGLTSDGSGS